MVCSLCEATAFAHAGRNRSREFYRCKGCGLIVVPFSQYLSIENEKKRYDLHDNTAENTGYVSFLAEVADVVQSLHRPEMTLLDYGCGKNAVLCGILEKSGIACCRYDPLYAYPLPKTPDCYDGIILCEVVEHLRDIPGTLSQIERLLTQQGFLLLRTQLYLQSQPIANWWYAQDPTHINFFSRNALLTLARRLHRRLEDTACGDIFLIR